MEYARFDGSEWLVETLDEYGTGRYPSIALDGNDQVHIAYENSSYQADVDSDSRWARSDGEGRASRHHGYGMGFVVGASGGMHLASTTGPTPRVPAVRNQERLDLEQRTVDEARQWWGPLRHSTRRQRQPHISYVDSTNGCCATRITMGNHGRSPPWTPAAASLGTPR